MWMVHTYDEGLIGIFDTYEEALKEYKIQKEAVEDYVRGENEFSSDECVVLAKVEKHFYSYDTKKPVMIEDDEGNEQPTKDTYWDFKEDTSNIQELTRIIARNLVAWDTSKDKREGLLPEVYLTNKYWYKQLTGEEYYQHKAVKKFNIE